RLASANTPGHPTFSLTPGSGPFADTLLDGAPMINVSKQHLETTPSGQPVARALNGLRLTYAHFLPLASLGQVVGLLVLAAKQAHDIGSPHGKKLLDALTSEAATVVQNARLVTHLAGQQEQTRAEQAFRKMVLDTMGDGLVVIDDQALIRYANNRLLRMSGYSRQELYGSSIGVIFHPEGR